MLLKKTLGRIGRRLYLWGRAEQRNAPDINGEYKLLEAALMSVPTNDIVIFDVGANLGNWTIKALDVSARKGLKTLVHCFEPAAATQQLLKVRLESLTNAKIVGVALSDHIGTAQFYSCGAGKGTNSLGASSGNMVESVHVTTVDDYLGQTDLYRVDLLKIDAEGFDYLVLKGAIDSLRTRRIRMIQFEYNWRWIQNGASLLSVFDLVSGLPYRLAKITKEGLLYINEWHFELDKYFEGNYALVRDDVQLDIPQYTAHVDSSNTLVWG